MNDQKGFQDKLLLWFKEYIDSLDDNSAEEHYNSKKGYAISALRKFLEFHEFEIPQWIKDYYKL